MFPMVLCPLHIEHCCILQSMATLKDMKVAKKDPRWHEAMMEELNALHKNETWELVHLPIRKKVAVASVSTL